MSWNFNLPPGCGTLPGEEPDPPCEVCGIDTDHCTCPECPECGVAGDPECYTRGHLSWDPSNIWCLAALADLYAEGTSLEDIQRDTYKYTSCGAWVSASRTGVAVGSIVEGVDMETPVIELNYPFTLEDFYKALEDTEVAADDIWNQTHGCEDCGPEDINGYRAINPFCHGCEGSGTIL